mmetsp:Transcript_107130/g.301508  ORF Transcript_107130/g.301508 Transcript_107130/m.301508 type:complete len:238 (+) Transcript_107130:735-1448(+)
MLPKKSLTTARTPDAARMDQYVKSRRGDAVYAPKSSTSLLKKYAQRSEGPRRPGEGDATATAFASSEHAGAVPDASAPPPTPRPRSGLPVAAHTTYASPVLRQRWLGSDAPDSKPIRRLQLDWRRPSPTLHHNATATAAPGDRRSGETNARLASPQRFRLRRDGPAPAGPPSASQGPGNAHVSCLHGGKQRKLGFGSCAQPARTLEPWISPGPRGIHRSSRGARKEAEIGANEGTGT